MTNMAARPDLIHAVTSDIPVTIIEILTNFRINYLAVNQKNEDLEVVVRSIKR